MRGDASDSPLEHVEYRFSDIGRDAFRFPAQANTWFFCGPLSWPYFCRVVLFSRLVFEKSAAKWDNEAAMQMVRRRIKR